MHATLKMDNSSMWPTSHPRRAKGRKKIERVLQQLVNQQTQGPLCGPDFRNSMTGNVYVVALECVCVYECARVHVCACARLPEQRLFIFLRLFSATKSKPHMYVSVQHSRQQQTSCDHTKRGCKLRVVRPPPSSEAPCHSQVLLFWDVCDGALPNFIKKEKTCCIYTKQHFVYSLLKPSCYNCEPFTVFFKGYERLIQVCHPARF